MRTDLEKLVCWVENMFYRSLGATDMRVPSCICEDCREPEENERSHCDTVISIERDEANVGMTRALNRTMLWQTAMLRLLP